MWSKKLLSYSISNQTHKKERHWHT